MACTRCVTTRPIDFRILLRGRHEPGGVRWAVRRLPTGTHYHPTLAAAPIAHLTRRGPERLYGVTLLNGPYRGYTATVTLADGEIGCRLVPADNPSTGSPTMWPVRCSTGILDRGNGNPRFWFPGAPGFGL